MAVGDQRHAAGGDRKRDHGAVVGGNQVGLQHDVLQLGLAHHVDNIDDHQDQDNHGGNDQDDDAGLLDSLAEFRGL